MKQAALKLMNSCGLFAPFRFLNRHKVLILMYHRFSATRNGFSTSAADFENHLQYLKRHYNVVSLANALTQLATLPRASVRTAVITIDDGYRDAYQVALPLLRKYRMPATIFVVTDFLDRNTWLWTDKLRFINLRTEAKVIEFEAGSERLRLDLSDRTSRIQAAARINSYLKSLPDTEKEIAIEKVAASLGVEIPRTPNAEFEALAWDELFEMEKQGIEVGSHTRSHPILTRVPLDRVRLELRESKRRLESLLGHQVPLFCYPNGISNDKIREEVQLAGYTGAVNVTYGFNNPKGDIFALNRMSAEHDLPHFIQSTSGFEGFKSALRSRGTTPELP